MGLLVEEKNLNIGKHINFYDNKMVINRRRRLYYCTWYLLWFRFDEDVEENEKKILKAQFQNWLTNDMILLIKVKVVSNIQHIEIVGFKQMRWFYIDLFNPACYESNTFTKKILKTGFTACKSNIGSQQLLSKVNASAD